MSRNRKNKKNRGIEDMSREKKDFRPPLHPPLTGNLALEVRRQHSILKEVYIADYDNYELGFRGDVHPGYEIGVWSQMADGFAHLAQNEPSLERRKAIFCAVFMTRMAGYDHAYQQPWPRSLGTKLYAKIVGYMYNTYGDPPPARLYFKDPRVAA